MLYNNMAELQKDCFQPLFTKKGSNYQTSAEVATLAVNMSGKLLF